MKINSESYFSSSKNINKNENFYPQTKLKTMSNSECTERHEDSYLGGQLIRSSQICAVAEKPCYQEHRVRGKQRFVNGFFKCNSIPKFGGMVVSKSE